MIPTTEADLAGALIAGRYRIVGTLGSGAMGSVYAAIDEGFGRKVAIKVIRPDAVDDKTRARFQLEALATSQLAHPNVVSVYDFGIDGGDLFLVLEHLAGVNLQQEIDVRGPMSWPRAVPILAQLAAAVSAAHEANIIHRDLKPKNIFLCHGPGIADFVKVLDFGIAKILGDGAPHVSTTTGVVLGTPGYVAPECMVGRSRDDPQSDSYAIGCVAFTLLAGRGPFTAKSSVLLLLSHMSERAPRLTHYADVPDALDELVSALLEKAPANRPTARALLSSLRALSSGD